MPNCIRNVIYCFIDLCLQPPIEKFPWNDCIVNSLVAFRMVWTAGLIFTVYGLRHSGRKLGIACRACGLLATLLMSNSFWHHDVSRPRWFNGKWLRPLVSFIVCKSWCLWQICIIWITVWFVQYDKFYSWLTLFIGKQPCFADDNFFNSLWPSDGIWCHIPWSTLVQEMACCLMTQSYHLNQCWQIIS